MVWWWVFGVIVVVLGGLLVVLALGSFGVDSFVIACCLFLCFSPP